MIIIDGTTTDGMGTANRTLSQQMPFLVKEFPEIRDCRLGTINVKLAQGLHIHHVDHQTGPINWYKDYFESFSFVRIQFECPAGAAHVRAWLYRAHDSNHFGKPDYVEIITQSLGNIIRGTPCRLHLRPGNVSVDG